VGDAADDPRAEAWPGARNPHLTRPELLEEVARLYLDAGAEIITANTFGGSPARLRQSGLDGETESINRAGVEAVRRAAGDHAYVSASVGPCGHVLKPYGDADPGEIGAGFARQVRALVEAGVDLICVETMTDLAEAILAVRAVRDVAPQVPVAATMTFEPTRRGFFTVMGNSIEQAVRGLSEAGADILGSNCGNGIEIMVEIAREFRARTDRPVGSSRTRDFRSIGPARSSIPTHRRSWRSRPACWRTSRHADWRVLRHDPGAHPGDQAGRRPAPSRAQLALLFDGYLQLGHQHRGHHRAAVRAAAHSCVRPAACVHRHQRITVPMTPAITALRAAARRVRAARVLPRPCRALIRSRGGVRAPSRPSLVFKTLVVSLDDGRLVVALVPANRELDLKALAGVFSAKSAVMAAVAAAERATGYVAGASAHSASGGAAHGRPTRRWRRTRA